MLEDAAKGFIAKQLQQEDGNTLTMVKWKCMGLTAEQLQPFLENPVETGTKVNDRLTVIPLEED